MDWNWEISAPVFEEILGRIGSLELFKENEAKEVVKSLEERARFEALNQKELSVFADDVIGLFKKTNMSPNREQACSAFLRFLFSKMQPKTTSLSFLQSYSNGLLDFDDDFIDGIIDTQVKMKEPFQSSVKLLDMEKIQKKIPSFYEANQKLSVFEVFSLDFIHFLGFGDEVQPIEELRMPSDICKGERGLFDLGNGKMSVMDSLGNFMVLEELQNAKWTFQPKFRRHFAISEQNALCFAVPHPTKPLYVVGDRAKKSICLYKESHEAPEMEWITQSSPTLAKWISNDEFVAIDGGGRLQIFQTGSAVPQIFTIARLDGRFFFDFDMVVLGDEMLFVFGVDNRKTLKVRLRNNKKQILWKKKHHISSVFTVKISPDQTKVVSGGNIMDNRIILSDFMDGSLLCSFVVNSSVMQMSYSPCGRFVLALTSKELLLCKIDSEHQSLQVIERKAKEALGNALLISMHTDWDEGRVCLANLNGEILKVQMKRSFI